MFDTKKIEKSLLEEKEETKPRYLREDYPYKAIENPITDLDGLEYGQVYEIWCNQCMMSIRSQGQNIKSRYEKMNGCISCGNKDLVIRRINISPSH